MKIAAKPVPERENDKQKHYNEEAILGRDRSSGAPRKEVLFPFIFFTLSDSKYNIFYFL
jgi:hypothetical protein